MMLSYGRLPRIPLVACIHPCPAKGKGSLTHREDPGKQQAQSRLGLRAARQLDRDHEKTRGRGNPASTNRASASASAPSHIDA